MAVNTNNNHNSYGLYNALQNMSPLPIVAKRNPTTRDKAEIGTLWVNNTSNAYYILTSFSGGDSIWTAQQTGAGTFAAVTVTGGAGTVLTVDAGGDTDLGGDLAVSGNATITGNLTVTGDIAAQGDFDLDSPNAFTFKSTANAAGALTFETDGGVAETIVIQSKQGTGLDSVSITSDAGGIKLEATASVSSDAINLVAPAGGVTVDAVKASAINVVGAGEDLQLNATGGSIAITATESAANAVNISASGAAGTVLINGTGGATLSATNNAVSIQSGTGAVNISTAATANTTTIGNATGASSVAINCGTGGVAVGTSANAHATTVGSTTAGSTLVLQTPAGTNVSAANGISVSTAGRGVSLPGGVLVLAGAGDPNGVVTGPIGSLFLRTDPAGAASRAYINTDAGTTWTNITCAA